MCGQKGTGINLTVSSSRLLLRPVTAADTDALFRIYGDPATNKFNPAGPYPHKLHAQSVMATWLTHWNHYGFGPWAIARLTQPQQIVGFGGLSIKRVGHLEMNNLGYRFAPEAWGQGLATEFSLRAIAYGFSHLRLDTITAMVRENHLVSQRVLLKSGLQFVGKVDDVPGTPVSLMYSLTATQWSKNLNNAAI